MSSATAALTILRGSQPQIPMRKHLFTIALTGASDHTIGLATINNSPEAVSHLVPGFTADLKDFQVAHVAQAVRYLGWLGFGPTVYPAFKGQTAFILCHADTGEPQAAVGLPPAELETDPINGRDDFPDHPETNALRITLAWHGASVRWLPVPRRS